MVNNLFLEVSVLFIFLVELFRENDYVNEFVLIISAIFLILFILLSLLEHLKLFYSNLRLIFLILIILIVHGSFLNEAILTRMKATNDFKVHDGVIITEAAYSAFISGYNPYSISYREVLEKGKYFNFNLPSYAEFSYPYSPMMFIVNIPVFAFSSNVVGFIDMRITLVIFFFLSALVGLLMIREKILFLILFLLNPLFVPLLYYGANEVILLFFFLLQVYFLYRKKVSLATGALAFATGTKLLILPLVPLYFLYIFMLKPKNSKVRFLFKQLLIFTLINLTVYLPFFVWNSSDLLNDLIFPWVGKGDLSHPIAGFLGLPQILSRMGFISASSSFPFFIFIPLIEVFFLIFAFYAFKSSLKLSTLCVFSAINLILIFAFSRLLQVYYIAFLSQILVFAGFVDYRKNK